ncbi:MAG: holo-[acyl-carrier-protein] synthase [Candidatus Komeilibacteria bacterium RIFCSPLOWO2_02_FULL_48_11]|uniref:Holo-[acyl-carrier-protein] synthase n=1 Tax=Candidatus Komeilibacteria bacterium RIFCSPLOWO2_02_FULL_48_11 TaxID=1798553 RepID=A0A1G2BRG5_9BACT|nr:MAG: holo-[acyl-carrier-protein] synthase [Candidatus Komeilibacteria bacterium RIFCSPLOWO2_02_FULL_48_11]
MIGIDITDINRFAKIVIKDFSHWSKFFTKSEWEIGFSAPDPARALAGIFAAKEAVMKASGGKLVGRFDRIQIEHEPDGKPIVKIDEKKQDNIHISISHDRDIVVAVAIKL